MADAASEGFSLPSVANSGDLFDAGQSDVGAPSEGFGNNNRGEQVLEGHSSGDAIPSSHVNFSHAIGAAWDSLPTTVVEPVWNSGFWNVFLGMTIWDRIWISISNVPCQAVSLQMFVNQTLRRTRNSVCRALH